MVYEVIPIYLCSIYTLTQPVVERNPVNSPVEFGTLSPFENRVLYKPSCKLHEVPRSAIGKLSRTSLLGDIGDVLLGDLYRLPHQAVVCMFLGNFVHRRPHQQGLIMK